MKLRNYQQAAVDAVYEHLRTRDDNPCIVIPTGGRKTPIIARLCSDAVEQWNGRVLVLAHVKELLEQSAATIRKNEPNLNVGVYSAGLRKRDAEHPVIVAGIQSVYNEPVNLMRLIWFWWMNHTLFRPMAKGCINGFSPMQKLSIQMCD